MNRYFYRNNGVTVKFFNIGEKVHLWKMRCIRVELMKVLQDHYTRSQPTSKEINECVIELGKMDYSLRHKSDFFA